MKNKVIKKLFAKDMIRIMENILNRFIIEDYDEEMIYKELKEINESVRTTMYLMALEKNNDVIAFRINKVNKIINEERRKKFLEAYENNEIDKFLSMLGKGDKISLMSDLGVDVEVRERANFTKEQRAYYEILSNSIIDEQEEDKRDGIETFIKYKKDEKEA